MAAYRKRRKLMRVPLLYSKITLSAYLNTHWEMTEPPQDGPLHIYYRPGFSTHLNERFGLKPPIDIINSAESSVFGASGLTFGSCARRWS
jgi:hypothetical protein